MNKAFPINYFTNIFSAKKIFKNRQQLIWWQILLIILLLNGLMLMPLSVQLGKIQSANLNDFVPNALATMNDDTVQQFNQMVEQGTVAETGQFIPSINEVDSDSLVENSILIAPDGFIIKEGKNPEIKQTYDEELPLTTVADKEALIALLSQHWFQANRLSIVLTNFINVWFLMFFNFVGLLLGTAFLLWLTKFGKIFTIANFNEALQLSLNTFGLPTLIAMLMGFLLKDPNVMALTQSTLYILLLLWVYWKTHFNDHYVETASKISVL